MTLTLDLLFVFVILNHDFMLPRLASNICKQDWPRVPDHSVFTSQVLELQACATMPNFCLLSTPICIITFKICMVGKGCTCATVYMHMLVRTILWICFYLRSLGRGLGAGWQILPCFFLLEGQLWFK